jgi:hypothetical protein
MKYILILSLFIASCQSKEKTPLEGTWEFDRNELYPGVESNPFMDSMLHMLEKHQAGLTLQFIGNNFKVTQDKDGRTEKMGNQPFELSADQKSLILKNTGRPDDIFPIVLLTDSVLKLNMFQSKEGYPVFLKKK